MAADSDQPISNPFLHGNLPLNSPLSPYLNINPQIFKEPQYIMPEGSAPKRGRFELAFSTIGGAAIAGAFYGGGNGIFRGLKDPAFQKAVSEFFYILYVFGTVLGIGTLINFLLKLWWSGRLKNLRISCL